MTGRRKWLVRVGIAALVLVLLVAVPGYIAAQPGFFRRFPGLSSRYEPWSMSTHALVACQSCHVPPTALARTAYSARMVGEFYMSLVMPSRTPNVFASPTNDACLSCHYDLRAVSPKGDLQIPHRAHVEVLKMRCIECHKYLVHELSPEGKHTPTMAGCLRCHNGDTAKNSCTTCHTKKAAPASHHVGNWDVIHPERAADPKCDSCHRWTDHWCADCHAHRPASHGPDWRTLHGQKVATHRNCEACHKGSFCVRCHGEVPRLNFDPKLKLVQ